MVVKGKRFQNFHLYQRTKRNTILLHSHTMRKVSSAVATLQRMAIPCLSPYRIPVTSQTRLRLKCLLQNASKFPLALDSRSSYTCRTLHKMLNVGTIGGDGR